MKKFYKKFNLLIAGATLFTMPVAAQWSGGFSASWIGSNSAEIDITALTVDGCNNTYMFVNPTSIQANKIKVANDTIDCQRVLIKLNSMGYIEWKLDMTNTAPSINIRKIELDESGNIYMGVLAGPTSGKDTTVVENDSLFNKALFMPSVSGNIDTIRIKPSDSRFYISPFLIKYTADGEYAGEVSYAGLNNSRVYDLKLSGDFIYFMCKAHALQIVTKINKNTLVAEWTNTVNNRWQDAAFYGNIAITPGGRLFTVIPYGNTPAGTSFSGGSQGYIVELDNATGLFSANYKKLNDAGFAVFSDFGGGKSAPLIHAVDDETFYFSSYALRGQSINSELNVDGQMISKEVTTVNNYPVIALAVLKFEDDTFRFESLKKIEQQSNNLAHLEAVSGLRGSDLYVAYGSYRNNMSNMSGVKISDDTAVYGANTKAKLIKMNALGEMSYVDDFNGSSNAPRNLQLIITPLNNVLYVARHTNVFSAGGLSTPGSRGTMAFQYYNNVQLSPITVVLSPGDEQIVEINMAGTTLTVSSDSPGEIQKIIWKSANAAGGPYTPVADSTAATFTPMYATEGEYYIVAELFDGCGFKTSNEVKFIVTTTTGIARSIENGLSVYPNPVDDIVNIEVKGYLGAHLYSMQGTLLIDGGKSPNLNLSGLPVGIYLLQVTTAEGVKSTKLVKK